MKMLSEDNTNGFYLSMKIKSLAKILYSLEFNVHQFAQTSHNPRTLP